MKQGARHILTVLRIGLGLGLLAYLGFSGVIQWSALWGMVTAWPVTLTALALLLLALVCIAWRLCVMLKLRDMSLSLSASLRLTLIGIFFNTCLPGAAGGDVVKIYYATKGNKGRRMEVTTVMLLDRVAGLFALLLWPLLAAPFFLGMIVTMPVLQGLLAGGAGLAAGLGLGLWIGTARSVLYSRWMGWLFEKLPLGHHIKNILETVYAYRSQWKTLLAAVGISLLSHTITFGATLLAATTVNPGGVAWQMCLLLPLGFLANVLPLTPGGLGVGEAAFDSLFGMAGLTGGAETLLGWRLLMLVIGLIGLIFYLRGRKQFVYAPSAEMTHDAPTLHPVQEPG